MKKRSFIAVCPFFLAQGRDWESWTFFFRCKLRGIIILSEFIFLHWSVPSLSTTSDNTPKPIIQPEQHVCLCRDPPPPPPSCSGPCRAPLAARHFTQTHSLASHRLRHLSQLQILPTAHQPASRRICQKLSYINLWQRSPWCREGGHSIFIAFAGQRGNSDY